MIAKSICGNFENLESAIIHLPVIYKFSNRKNFWPAAHSAPADCFQTISSQIPIGDSDNESGIFYDNLSPSQWMMIIWIIMQKGWILVFWMPLRHNMPIWMPIWSNSHSMYATNLGTNKVLFSQLNFVYINLPIYVLRIIAYDCVI